MSGVVTRDPAEVRRAFSEWSGARLASQGVEASGLEVDLASHTAGGYSNEVFFATVTYLAEGERHEERLVVRLPPTGPALFPTYDLAMQVAVQAAVGGNGVPVPSPVTVEDDERWLGSSFLVMPRVAGHDPGELPVADEWVAAATVAQQQEMHERFLDTLARIHTTPWRGQPVAAVLRGGDAALSDEVRWWAALADWAFDGAPPSALTASFDWCADHCPTDAPAPSVLWGDVRLGNVVFDDSFAPAAVLDWEMASIGPAEMDLAWFTALDAMAEHFVGRRVPGFLTRDEVVARHEQALGRSMVAFRWFEIFAMCRSAALNLRADRLGALRLGKAPRPAERNAVLAYAIDAIASFDDVG